MSENTDKIGKYREISSVGGDTVKLPKTGNFTHFVGVFGMAGENRVGNIGKRRKN